MTDKQKRFALILAALATVALIWWAPDPQSAESEPATRTASADTGRVVAKAAHDSAATQSMGVPQVPPEDRDGIVQAKGLFAAGSWYVAPPVPKMAPPPPPPPPPPPTAPTLPFTFMGKYIEDGVTQVILTKGNRVITAVVGEVIDANYRVERIDPSAVVLTYLPLHISQSVPTGSSQ